MFYDPVYDTIRRRVGYRGIFREEGVNLDLEFENHKKIEKMYFPHARTSWEKYMCNGIPKLKF